MTRSTDLHRVYLQSMLSRRVVRLEIGLELYKRAVANVQEVDDTFRPTHDTDKEGYLEFIAELNRTLEKYGMLLRREKDESPKGRSWVVLVNNQADEVGMTASDLTPNELAYLRDLLQEIFESYPAMSIGSTRALKLAGEQQTKIKKTDAEALLESMVSRGWFIKSRRGRYSLDTRGLLELDPYLTTHFSDLIHKCQRCSKLMTVGWRCENVECEGHWHLYCYEAIKRISRNGNCPLCHESLDGATPIGEQAVPRAQDTFANTRGRKRVRDRPRRSGARDEESELDELEEEEGMESQSQEQSQSQSQSQTQSQAQDPPRRVSARWAVESDSQPKRKRPNVVPETQFSDDE